MDAHTPYIPRDEHNRYATSGQLEKARTIDYSLQEYLDDRRLISELQSLEAAYDDCIRQADEEVGRIIDELRNRDELQNTLLVITADHGEGFGEDGTVMSGPSIAHGGTGGPEEGVLRVPLLTKRPGQTAGRVVREPISLTVFPDIVRCTRGTEKIDASRFTTRLALTSSLGLSEAELDSTSAAEDIVSQYNKEARIVYEWTDDDTLLKHTLYGEEGSTFDVTDIIEPKAHPSADSETIVQEVFADLEHIDEVHETQTDELDEGVEQRLEDLGYR